MLASDRRVHDAELDRQLLADADPEEDGRDDDGCHDEPPFHHVGPIVEQEFLHVHLRCVSVLGWKTKKGRPKAPLVGARLAPRFKCNLSRGACQ